MGSIEGLFIATDEEVQRVKGKEIYLGEVLGKHSEIFGTFEEDDIKELSNDCTKIPWLEELLGKSVSGYNPLDYIDEYEDE